MSTKLQKSIDSHRKLRDQHESISQSYSQKTSQNFWATVKRDYHWEIMNKQMHEKRILSDEEKKNIYTRCKNSLIDYRKGINKVYGFGRYVPNRKK